MESQAKRIEKITQDTLLRTIVTAVFCVILVIIQIATQYSSETRTVAQGFFSTFSNVTVTLATLYIATEYFLLSRKLTHYAGDIKTSPIPIIGIAMIGVAICFYTQFITDVIAVFKKGVSLLEIAAAKSEDATVLTFLGDKNGLAVIVAVFCFLSGASFLLDGLSMWAKRKKCPFWLRLAPPIWGGVTLLYIMISYPSIVSAQSDISKVFGCIITILFLLFNASELCGMTERKSREFSLFVRLSFSILMFLTNAPYGISMLFFTKVETVNVPHVVYFGLLIFGAFTALQIVVQALLQILKFGKPQRVSEPSGVAPKVQQEIEKPDEKSVEWSYFEE